MTTNETPTPATLRRQTFRWPEADVTWLKDRYAATFEEHRLSFNAWVLGALKFALTNSYVR